MSELNPITREEVLLDSVANGTPSNLTPITRQEIYLSAIAGESELPADMKPITREEEYYQMILDNGGAGGGGDEATGTKTININSNGTTSHNVKAYATAQIITNVPNPSTGTKNITSNGDHDVTDYATAHVAVPQPSGSTNITQNGTHNVADYEEAVVNVPNSYSSSDEGKVVSNGELTAQTSRQVTANGTYDTTLNSSVEVAVPASGITPTGTKNITTNGDHDVTQFATAHVDVPTGITPSGTKQISITENGTTTEDVTNYANAEITVNVQSSGGAEYYTGTVVFSDTEVTSLTLPVGIGANDEFLVEFYMSKSGTVVDGVVTIDTQLEKHNTSENIVLNGLAQRYRGDGSIKVSGNKPFRKYCMVQTVSTTTGVNPYNINADGYVVPSENSLTINPVPSFTPKFCGVGDYFEFTYHVFVARNAL